ncbi:MAG: hypothetical protein JXB26_04590 [Candidatus Aminicenantes bacterium]|nr:hypothetical protein [Candidatus Aminicenantes bacterium]
MRKRTLCVLLVLFIPAAIALFALQEEPKPAKLYIRATIYPTFSLSRYDYNNDIDLVRIRTYIELRKDSQTGEVIPDAEIAINSQPLDFKEDHYEKRIPVDKENLPEKISLRIVVPEEPTIEETYPIPDWLTILSPKPAIFDPDIPLSLKWNFQKNKRPVNAIVYDFKSGENILRENDIEKTEVIIPAEKIPGETIVRLYVISAWIFKKWIIGENVARGSEINMIPWSQVFIRTK